jgi:hypothetical protein
MAALPPPCQVNHARAAAEGNIPVFIGDLRVGSRNRVVTGDLTTSGGLSGSGILLVEGTLTLSGNPSYNGLILVIGKGVVTKNGGGNGTLDGAMLVANLYNSSNQLITSGSPGTPTINWNGGGNATVQYDSCWANALNASLPYSSIGVREMMY